VVEASPIQVELRLENTFWLIGVDAPTAKKYISK
jgi:hypothetical protein